MALEGYVLLGLLFSLLLLILDFYLLKRRRINGFTFVVWLVVGVAIGTFAIVPTVYLVILRILGTEFAISAIVGVGFLSLLLITFYLHVLINDLRDKVMKLTAEVSALKFRNGDEK